MDDGARESSSEINAGEAKGFAPDWVGFKFAMDCRVNAAVSGMVVPACRRDVFAIWLEPEDVLKWAAFALERCPDLSRRFPWTVADDMYKSLSKPVPAAGGRSGMRLGEAQALCALMWILHAAYELYDEQLAANAESGASSVAPYVERGRFAPEHALQLPWSPPSEGDKGSEGYYRCVFSFASGDVGSDLAKRTAAAFEVMGRALEGCGALDASRSLAESSVEMKAAAPNRRAAMADLDALESMEEYWERLDVSRSALLGEQAGPGPRL
jgi:hypothetical protein